MLGPREVVLEGPVGAVVRTTDGTLWLTSGPAGEGGSALDGNGPVQTRVGGATVVAGLLPAGAIRAVVIDDRGDEHEAQTAEGAWMAVLSRTGFEEELMRFLDARGAIVPRPLPAGETIAVDADEPCPVCGARRWAQLADAGTSAKVWCASCGFRLMGGWIAVGGIWLGSDSGEVRDPEAAEDDDDDADPEWQLELERSFRRLTVPVYAAAGLGARITGVSGGERTPVTGVTVSQGGRVGDARWIMIETSSKASGLDVRQLLAGVVGTGWEDMPERSESGLTVWMSARDRAARRTVAAVPVQERRMTIDGAPEPFELIGVGGTWIAARDHYGVRVTVSAAGFAPEDLTLERLDDPLYPEMGTDPEPPPDVVAARRAGSGVLLDRAGVLALIERHGLGADADTILDAVQAGYRLVASDGGRTRIGGLPDLAPDEAWPHAPDGMPYTFLAQIDCSALPPLADEWAGAPWDHGGELVRIFADLHARIPEPRPAVALSVPADAPVTRAELPPLPDPLPPHLFEPDDDSMRQLREVPVTARPFLTVPQGWIVGVSEEAAFRDFVLDLREGGGPPAQHWGASQILGHADHVQGADPRDAGPWLRPGEPALAEAGAWRVVLSLVESHGLRFWDAGAIAIVAPVADLAARRYDRLVAEPQMG